MTLLADLVRTSQRVGATAARLAKVRELASFLRALPPDEIETAAHYLSGETPQGRVGLGYSTLQAAGASGAASTETLSIAEVDRSLALIATIRGAGSAARRAEALRDLFRRATAPEQQFLLHLLVGELRQGALAGSMVEAIAAAAELPVAQVRRAAMYAKSLGAVARAALLEGADALGRFQLELFAPVAPMLAQTAADVGEALRELQGEVAFEWKMDGARIQVHKRGEEVRIYTRALYEAALAGGHEGVMAKSRAAAYEAGNRGASWLKIKRAHTLDLVVLAAEWGHGRRTGKLSNLHLGAREPVTGEYVMLGKTFKGLTDAMLKWQTTELLARETHRDQWTVYVRPELVVEVAFSDLQASSRYPGGLALRLARVKRYRDDKRAEDADTMETVRKVYAA